jgi:hypothetical protein
MATSVKEPVKAVTDKAPAGALEVSELCFVAEAPADALVVREFSQPRSACAVKTAVAPANLGGPSETATGTSVIVFVPADAGNAVAEGVRAKLAGEKREPSKAAMKHGSELVEWWPGRVLIQAGSDARADVQAAVIDFLFYEAELRELERLVTAGEAQAVADLEVGHRVHPRDRRRWTALFDAMERFTRARLVFARLEPELSGDLSSLSAPARRWLGRLYDAALVEDRAEALSYRLEALEDFYEAATQRIADFRWYREGRLLELTIIAILVLECLLMAGDLFLHFAPAAH